MSSTEPTAPLAAAAPSSLRGWSILQRAVNVELANDLRTALKLLDEAARVLAGKAG